MKAALGRLRGRLQAAYDRRRAASAPALPFDGFAPAALGLPRLDALPDDELRRLNAALPWSAYIVDGRGRRFGNAYSATKRTGAQALPDHRIVELDRRVGLAGKRVLEVGCFEGIHTAALCHFGASVLAVDSRIENVAKTAARCAVLGYQPDVARVDLEEPWPAHLPRDCDILHHIGVLYHLTDPVAHLHDVLPHVANSVLLDTHVAPENAALATYSSGGKNWQYYRFGESTREEPFAGMRDHAKWLPEATLVGLLLDAGFANVDVSDRRAERAGPRVLIYATR